MIDENTLQSLNKVKHSGGKLNARSGPREVGLFVDLTTTVIIVFALQALASFLPWVFKMIPIQSLIGHDKEKMSIVKIYFPVSIL